MASYHDVGVALRTVRLGEADRIVTFITREHGKIRAVAKGVRKTKSHIGARVEPLSHATLLCWRGRELDVVTQVEVIDHFRAIREDLDRLSQAMTMLEIIDQVTLEHNPAPELYALLVGALRALDEGGSPLVLGAFCWKLLSLEGVAPIIDSCARCGSKEPLVAFDASEGGFLCRSHRKGQAVSEDVVELVRRILSGGLARALKEPTSPAAAAVEDLGTSAVEHHIDRRLRSMRHKERSEVRSAL
jgi:DNA repair protein RecO (recombination protein O)